MGVATASTAFDAMLTSRYRFGIGWGAETGSGQVAWSAHQLDNNATSAVSSRHGTTGGMFVNITATNAATDCIMDLGATSPFDGNDIDFDYTETDATARKVMIVGFGQAAAAGTFIPRLLLLGVG